MLLGDGQIMNDTHIQPHPAPGPPSPPLKANQWLAVDSFFAFHTAGGKTFMTVSSLPAGKAFTYLKKSETNSKNLPASELKNVTKGETFALASAPRSLGTGRSGYWLVTLSSGHTAVA